MNHYRSPGGASRLNDVAPQSQMPNLFLRSRLASRAPALRRPPPIHQIQATSSPPQPSHELREQFVASGWTVVDVGVAER